MRTPAPPAPVASRPLPRVRVKPHTSLTSYSGVQKIRMQRHLVRGSSKIQVQNAAVPAVARATSSTETCGGLRGGLAVRRCSAALFARVNGTGAKYFEKVEPGKLGLVVENARGRNGYYLRVAIDSPRALSLRHRFSGRGAKSRE